MFFIHILLWLPFVVTLTCDMDHQQHSDGRPYGMYDVHAIGMLNGICIASSIALLIP